MMTPHKLLQAEIDKVKAADKTIKWLNEKIAENKAIKDEASAIIIDLMDGLNISEMTDDLDAKVKIKPEAYISVTIANREKLKGYLGSQASVVFEKVEEKYQEKELEKIIRKKIVDGEEIPDWINVYFKDSVKIK